MSSRDAERYIRQELEGVLAEFDLEYEFTTRSKHEAIEFMANGKRCVFTFTGSSDPRAAMNARSDLRRLILSAGVQKVIPPEKEEIIEPKAAEEPPRAAPAPSPPLPKAPPVSQYESLNTAAEYFVYQPKLLVPGKCIVLELDRDLMAEKGSLLVVALHRPNTFTTFTREQFNALFRRMEVAPPEPVATPDPIPDPRVEILEKDRERMEARIAELQAKIEELAQNPGPTTYSMPEEPPQREKKPRRSNIVIEGNPYRVGPRNINGVTPQMGRVLATMAHVSDITHRVDLEPSSCKDFLSPADYYQYTARVTGLIKIGLVERSLPLAGGHGWHNKVTPAGRRIINKLKDWPWLFDGQPVPSWFR